MSNHDDEGLDDLEPLSPEEEQAVSALLASLPSEPMPAEVFARIEAALAAEPAPVGVAPVIALESARSRRSSRGPMIFKVAASVVGLVGAVALGLAVVQGGGSSSAGGASADSAAGGTKSVETAPSAAPAASSAAAGSAPAASSSSKRTQVSATGTNYDAANLDTAVAALVTRAPAAVPTTIASSTTASGELSGAGTGTNAYSADEVATRPLLLGACVKEITAGDVRTPVAVDVGRWNGEPALVIVLPARNDPTTLEVFVVKPTCGQVQDSSDFLQFTSIPRP